ncbi:MAG TPA: Uma2 family endonuclease [Candidatus Sulfotelmatobacter sp.]|nr:Uma2 family endonuclease [Candidatus Sulfotelmatobacter sp.]
MRAELDEIVLPERKPALEWIGGRAVQKVSPKYTHAALQGRLTALLSAWADGRGRVGPEWRFRLAPPGEARRPLVPDVAYLSFARLAADAYDAAEEPTIAPDAAFEILSPGNRRRLMAEKTRVYLAAGAGLVAILDPFARTLTVHDGMGARTLRGPERLEHAALPGFAPSVDELLGASTLRPPRD